MNRPAVLKDSRACPIFNDESWPISFPISYTVDSDLVGGQCYLATLTEAWAIRLNVETRKRFDQSTNNV